MRAGSASTRMRAVEWARLAETAAVPEAMPVGLRPQRVLLGFRLGAEPYGVGVEHVREIVRVHAITPIPRAPAWLRGVVSLRGEMVQVIDLRRRRGLPDYALSRSSRIVVLHGDRHGASGLLVDAVQEVMRVPEDAIRACDAAESDPVSAMCEREGRFVLILDVERLLRETDD